VLAVVLETELRGLYMLGKSHMHSLR
jgi:hypothetical protein